MSRSSVSSASSRAADIEHYKDTYNVDHDCACLLVRAERLQEKGQNDQALIYFERVLQNYPDITEARVNAQMIRDMTAASLQVVQESERVLPNSAEISFYSELGPLPYACFDVLGGERCSCLKRLPNRRSEYQDDSEVGHPPRICFPPDQSDSLWSELLEAMMVLAFRLQIGIGER